ncbi:DUF1194 domain-containing protein [Afifella sp. IM 167]|uniref:DUF1194 domain-containing protein n=1 Tax=Afifella sp. IM 167 TaxID=2033586 RepID=UPI001CCAD9B8|nr:DUF1194 domain-containing protein [Afifella sp. IM 167]MBZ8134009.1 hypothetical protein [Afifella sp. IM 167]
MVRLTRLALLLFLLLPRPAGAADIPVDLELVLAVDASSSIDAGEFRLQMEGISAALRHPQVIAAIRGGPVGRIAISLVVWADATLPKEETGWYLVGSAEEAERLANDVYRLRRAVLGGTGIGAGIAFSMRKFERNGFSAPRQTVDVSGDGKETPPRENVLLMPAARAMAISRGVTVNGLAILNEDEDVGEWYRRNVIAGRSAFVMEVADFQDFAIAMVKKLVREIEDRPKIGMAE